MTPSHLNLASHRLQGTWAAIIGVTVLSFDALLVRLAAANEWDVMFWRGFFIFLTMASLSVRSGQWRAMLVKETAGAAWSVALLYGVSTGLFVLSVSNTMVANTVVILSSSPFFAALFSWLLIGEVIRLRTSMAILACMFGVAVVFSSSMESGGWLGDGLALVLAILMGLSLTILRSNPGIPRIPIIAVSGMVAALLALPFAHPLTLEADSYGWLALMGLLQMPMASLLIMVATRYLPSPEVSLFLLIETVLAPVWVWWVVGEIPPSLALVGGVIVIGTIAVHSILALKQERSRVVSPI
ncbi:EamA family transporter [Hahella sp. CCB-MM4]|uniref:DMT family transporter n=1 Tax=Hahella sp. (strain CCB-MM4) TaxID=1926491 RepID=UPI000BD46BD0|nr:DMT family transporter [Hahella sp. CCB-MM4]OZG71020.1 EamA family transporter [Hahella sp. CCB-MM4]